MFESRPCFRHIFQYIRTIRRLSLRVRLKHTRQNGDIGPRGEISLSHVQDELGLVNHLSALPSRWLAPMREQIRELVGEIKLLPTAEGYLETELVGRYDGLFKLAVGSTQMPLVAGEGLGHYLTPKTLRIPLRTRRGMSSTTLVRGTPVTHSWPASTHPAAAENLMRGTQIIDLPGSMGISRRRRFDQVILRAAVPTILGERP